MTDARPFTHRELAACAEREIRFRQRVYPRLVGERRMTQAKADLEIAMMVEIAAILARMADYAEKKVG